MATGTGNLPNPGMSFSPFAILTAEEQNQLVANIESLATGTGIGDRSISGSSIALSTVQAASLLNGKVYRRRGGSATSWQTPGSTNYDVSASEIIIQTGAVTSTDNTTSSNNGSFSTSAQTLTFPVAYSQPPMVLVSPQGDHAFATVTSTSNASFGWRGRSSANVNANVSITWIAIGV